MMSKESIQEWIDEDKSQLEIHLRDLEVITGVDDVRSVEDAVRELQDEIYVLEVVING